MNNRTSRQNSKGFTLAELLIVVAIIGVLVAIAIPLFTSQLKRARAATCLSNRDSLRRQMSVEMIDDSNNRYADEGDISLTDAEKGQFTCPSHGDYTATLKDGVITVTCSIADHNDEESGDQKKNQKVKSVIDTLFANFMNPDNDVKSTTLNSDYQSATTSETYRVIAGVDIAALNAGVWQMTKDTFTWTIGQNTSGSKISNVPAIQYDSKSGKYTIGTVTLDPSTAAASDKIGRINGFKSSGTFFDTYTEALAALK